jgi:hypothetical protein
VWAVAGAVARGLNAFGVPRRSGGAPQS